MLITTQSNLKAEKLRIVIGNLSLELVVVNLLDGTYLIADGYASDIDYPLISVDSLEKSTVKPQLEEFLLVTNLMQGDITSEDIDVIADTIEKLNL